jgi:hypothetical protein
VRLRGLCGRIAWCVLVVGLVRCETEVVVGGCESWGIGGARVMGAASSQSNVTARQDWDARVTLFCLHTALRH